MEFLGRYIERIEVHEIKHESFRSQKSRVYGSSRNVLALVLLIKAGIY